MHASTTVLPQVPLLALSLLCAPLTGLASTSDLPSSLARCAAVEDSAKRLACFDALATSTPPPRSTLTLTPVPADSGESSPATSAPMTAEAAPAAKDAEMHLDTSSERRFLGVRLYRPNYMLPVAYNDSPNRNLPAQESIDIPFLGSALDKVEMKFQISFEVPFWTRILDQPLDMYFAYTQLAFFQAYNREYSSPFRETNYEPELGLNWQPDISLFGWRLTSARAMVNHQSNGRSNPLSRSWNRMIGQFKAEHDEMTLGLRIWSPLETSPSDNPDIYTYLGYGELYAGYDLEKHHFGVMLRNPTHPTVQLDWSYPIGDTVRFYVQYFNGYGESLLDYDHSVNRIGVGFMLNEWP